VTFLLTNKAGVPASMTANTGSTPQTANISTAFTNPLAVTVKDASGNAVPGAGVTFTAPATGASGKFSNGTATITVVTNASGIASATFTANATAGGPYTVTAVVTGLPAVNFSLTNRGPAASMTALLGSTPQTVAINHPFPIPIGVTVKDALGNPVPGVNVIFIAPSSGASGKFSNGSNTMAIVTNASGVASSTFTANNIAGKYTVRAQAAGLTNVTFSLTN
jgi:hypothetical protein